MTTLQMSLQVGDIVAWSPLHGGTGHAVVTHVLPVLGECRRLFKACLNRDGRCPCFTGLIEWLSVEEINGPERASEEPMPKWTEGNALADGSGKSIPSLVHRPQGEFTVERVKVVTIEDVDNEACRKHGIEPAWDTIGDDWDVQCDWEPEGDDWGECPHDGFPLNDHARHFARMSNGEVHCLACAVHETLKEAPDDE